MRIMIGNVFVQEKVGSSSKKGETMLDEKLSTTKVRRVNNKSEASYSSVNSPYFRYLDERDGDRELE